MNWNILIFDNKSACLRNDACILNIPGIIWNDYSIWFPSCVMTWLNLFYITKMPCIFKKDGVSTRFTISCDMNDGFGSKRIHLTHIHVPWITDYPILQKWHILWWSWIKKQKKSCNFSNSVYHYFFKLEFVLVEIMTDSTRLRAIVQHNMRVISRAFAIRSPICTGAFFICARCRADTTHLWTIFHNCHWIIETFSFTPSSTLCGVLIHTCHTTTYIAAIWTRFKHKSWILAALSICCPIGTRLVGIQTYVMTNSTRKRATIEHKLWILCAMSTTAPFFA